MNDDEQRQVYFEQVRQLFDHAPFGLAATSVNSFILVIVLWNVISHFALITWFLSLTLVTFFRIAVLREYRRHPDILIQPQKWSLLLAVGTALSGTMWGMSGIFLFPVHSFAHQVFIAFVLGGMVAGAAVAFSALMRTFVVFGFPALVPITVKFFTLGGDIHMGMGMMMVVFMIFMFINAMRIQEMNERSLKLRFENNNLITYLADAKEKAETINEQLKFEIIERAKIEEELNRHREHLEHMVQERTSELTKINDDLKKEIWERKRAEGALRESEERFRAIFESAEDSVFIKDLSLKYTNVNPSMERLFDLPASYLIGLSDSDLFGEEAGKHIRDVDRRVLEGNVVKEEHSKPVCGEMMTFDIVKVPLRNKSGEVVGLCGIARDTTKRKKVEENLRSTLKKLKEFESIVNRSPAVVFRWRAGEVWSVEFVTDNVEQFGYTAEDLMSGRISWSGIIHPADVPRLEAEIAQHAREGITEFAMEYRIITKSEDMRWIEDRTLAIEDADGIVTHYQGIILDITKRKNAEEALWESEVRFSTVFEKAAVGIVVVDARNRKYTDINPAFQRMLGYTLEEFLRMSPAEISHPGDWPSEVALLKELYRGNIDHYQMEKRYIKKDGGILWSRLSVSLVRNSLGRPLYSITIIEDVSESKRVEEALRKSEERYRMIFNHSPLGIMHFDQAGVIIDCNEKFLELMGSSRDKIVGFNMLRHLVDDAMRSAVLTALSGEIGRYQGNYLSVTGNKLTPMKAIYSRMTAEDGTFLGAVGLFEDITEQTRAEDALRKSEARYRAIVEDQTELISRFSSDGTLTFVNDAYCRYFGESPGELIGHKFWHHLPEEDHRQVKEHIDSLNQEDPVVQIEHRVVASSGEVRWLQWTDRAIFDDHGMIMEYQAVGRDVTDRKLDEENLKRLNAQLVEEHDRRKSLSKKLIELLEKDRSRIAMELHDHIGQILTTIKMDLEWIACRMDQVDGTWQNRIQSAREKSLQAIRGIKDIAYGLRPSILDNLGLLPSIEALIKDIELSSNLKVHFFSRNVPKRLHHEKETSIYRIAQEALCNVTKHAKARNVYVNLVARDGVVALSVEDDGVGFEPGQVREEEDGKGPLGLLIMEERVVQIDGEFSLESRAGGGTHILVEIPL